MLVKNLNKRETMKNPEQFENFRVEFKPSGW